MEHNASVLIVDDEPGHASAVAELLGRIGLRCEVDGTGEDGLEDRKSVV